ncbi:MAG: ABC transporter permease, partial [Alphaproteobacteria bacterium]|nr:ABC transporter permease [Alphaproteobacteria bacterium]
MWGYFLGRLAIAVPTLFIVTIIVFGLQHLLPGDPALALLGEDRSPEAYEQVRKQYHLDKPVPVQYVMWIGNALTGDLGASLRTKKPVADLIAEKLPVTVQLALMSMAIALLIGIPTGILSAVRRNSFWDYAANVLGLSGQSVPTFWLGIMLILLFSVRGGLLPASGYVSPFENLGDNLRAMIMPAFVLGAALAAVMMRHTRGAMLSVLRSDYV